MKPTVIISGATKGIGKAIAQKFAMHGAILFIAARTLTDLKEMQLSLQLLNKETQVFIYSVDFSKTIEIESFVNHIINNVSKIDVLINNVGVYAVDQIDLLTAQMVRQQLQINVLSAISLTTPFIPLFQKQKFGHIFNLLSVASIQAIPNATAYTISKYALNGYTVALRDVLKNYNIKVTGVYSGSVFTDSWINTNGEDMIQPEDIANLIYQCYNTSVHAYTEEIVIRPKYI